MNMKRACELLVAAYERGEQSGGSIEWSDVDLAFEAAKAALAAPSDQVIRVLDISTDHLTADERQKLEDGELPGQAYTGEHGVVVSTAPYEEGERDDLPDGVSETLVAIMREAVRRGCSYVGFDADAALFPDLPTFDDEEAP